MSEMRRYRLEPEAYSPRIDNDLTIPIEAADVWRNAAITNNDLAPIEIVTADDLPICTLRPGQTLRYCLPV